MKKAVIAAVSALISIASVTHAQANPRVYTPQFDKEAQRSGADVPQVQVWLDDNSLRVGDIIRPYAVTEPGAYLTVVRVTTDGELRVLYPQQPRNQTRYREGQFANDRLPINGDGAWTIREGSGNGFVFAIASYYKFDYSYYSTSESSQWWSTARLASAGRYGSPFEIVRRFVEEISEGSDSYSMDYIMYDVNANGYRSRYASRYRGYGYSDYVDLCYNSFSVSYYSYCRGYYGYPFVVAGNPSTPPGPTTPTTKSMRIRPLIHDPSIGHGPPELPTTEGRFPVGNPSEQAAMAKRERMLRDVHPRTEPQQPMMRAEPRSEPRMAPREQPRMEPRMTPRSEPRVERIEMRRADPPPPQPRVEMRAAPPPPPPPPKTQKDN